MLTCMHILSEKNADSGLLINFFLLLMSSHNNWFTAIREIFASVTFRFSNRVDSARRLKCENSSHVLTLEAPTTRLLTRRWNHFHAMQWNQTRMQDFWRITDSLRKRILHQTITQFFPSANETPKPASIEAEYHAERKVRMTVQVETAPGFTESQIFFSVHPW